MFYIKIILEEADVNGQLTQRSVRRTIKWPTIPRLGEQLAIGGNAYPVTEVSHELDEGPGSYVAICVRAQWWEDDFKGFIEDPNWERCGF